MATVDKRACDQLSIVVTLNSAAGIPRALPGSVDATDQHSIQGTEDGVDGRDRTFAPAPKIYLQIPASGKLPSRKSVPVRVTT